MLLLAHLMSRNWEWARARIRLVRVVDDRAGQAGAQAALSELIKTARVEAHVKVVVSTARFEEVLREHSADADCVLLGFELPEDGAEDSWHHWSCF